MTRRSSSRRDFLKTSAAAGAALSLAASVHAAGGDTLKVGLIGAGGRGKGAAEQALLADPNVKLYAIGDAFADRIKDGLDYLTTAGRGTLAKKLDVAPERQFVGFDAYKRVTDCCDVVLLTTPPHFRPAQIEYAVEKGKHMFVEKPVAVDAPGVRRVLAACAEAKKKQLAVVSGLCWRYKHSMREAFKRIHGGEVGDIVALHCTYNARGLWKKDRQPGWTDTDYQLRNWLYYTWLSGDHIVEQAIHSLDKGAWAMKDEPPLSVTASGGRQARTAPVYGHIFDHFAATFEYANGVKLFHFCRQWDDADTGTNDYVMGTKGTCEVLPRQRITRNGADVWSYEAPPGDVDDMYQNEHNELFASIRRGEPINNGEYMARSTLLAIMARMAAYTGKTIKWDDALKSTVDLTPKEFKDAYSFRDLPTPRIAIPGKTKVKDNLW